MANRRHPKPWRLAVKTQSQNTRRAAADVALPFFLSLLVLVGMLYGAWTWWRVSRAETERALAIPQIGPPIKDFTLTERSGKKFRAADMKGKVWVVSYFFTSCPGECLRLNRNIQVMHMMPELKDVTWVSITCDPDTDTVEALNQYANALNADPNRWLFCRGDMEYTQRVAKGMDLFLSRKGHSNYAVVIDKAGKIHGPYDGISTQACEEMQKKLAELESESPPTVASKDAPSASRDAQASQSKGS
jgi:cytochrome oxidase Cu insertion factor (SCO1/SenC/PrrC family)